MPPLYVDHGRDPIYVSMHEPSLDTTMTPMEFATTGVAAENHDPPREINLFEIPSGDDQSEHDLVLDLADRQIRDGLHFEDEGQQQEALRGSASLPPPYESV